MIEQSDEPRVAAELNFPEYPKNLLCAHLRILFEDFSSITYVININISCHKVIQVIFE